MWYNDMLAHKNIETNNFLKFLRFFLTSVMHPRTRNLGAGYEPNLAARFTNN